MCRIIPQDGLQLDLLRRLEFSDVLQEKSKITKRDFEAERNKDKIQSISTAMVLVGCISFIVPP